MPWQFALANLVHVLMAVLWVGGMFFAYYILRPVAGARLEAPQRLLLWRHVLAKFFVVVWFAVILLLMSGYWMGWQLFGGMAGYPFYVHLMHGLAWIMAGVFLYAFFGPLRLLRQRVDGEAWPAAGAALARIRVAVGVNLALGLIVVVAAAAGSRLGL